MKNAILKKILVLSGTICIILGIIGIFVPLLPTTPFLLLAAACYARGSKKFYYWLINNKWLGEYIKSYQEGKGIPLIIKLSIITLLWISIFFSIIIFVSNPLIKFILIIIAIGVTIHILTIKTTNKKMLKTNINTETLFKI
jgi:hypothetical protein